MKVRQNVKSRLSISIRIATWDLYPLDHPTPTGFAGRLLLEVRFRGYELDVCHRCPLQPGLGFQRDRSNVVVAVVLGIIDTSQTSNSAFVASSWGTQWLWNKVTDTAKLS